jgi:glucose/mannose-6-phosphate isomerase
LDLTSLPEGKFRHYYYAGMGGSSLPADLINEYLKGRPSLKVVRDYALPEDAGAKDLVLCVSYSGNTEETLSCFHDAGTKGCARVVLSNDGKIKNLAEAEGVPFIPIPDCIQPRCATGYFFASTLGLLHRLQLLDSAKGQLRELAGFLEDHQDKFESTGKELSAKLKGRVPIVYGPTELEGVCRIWKIKFNENAKVQSFYNVFPELNHNEMVGYTQLIMEPSIIYLKNSKMHPRNRRRMEVLKEVLGDKIPIHGVNLAGDNLLQESFAALAVGDYTSYYLAEAYGIDPAPVAMVEDFKKRLGPMD